MPDVDGRSLPQKITLGIGHAMVVVAACWLLLSGAGPADPPSIATSRAWLLCTFAIVYLLRLAGTLLVFLKRAMPWTEVAIVLPWMATLHLTFAWAGHHNPAPLGGVDLLAVLLYVVGSVLNTVSEMERKRWKRDHPDRLFTGGLFRYSRHINYFGDTLLFSGYALLTGVWWTFVLPLVMTAGFVFEHIPRLEKHLAEKYGAEFHQWSTRTARFIPFLY